jgi:hypothetical protein
MTKTLTRCAVRTITSCIAPTKKRKDRGYSVIAYNEDYNKHDPDCEEHVEPWAICRLSALHECLMDYYNKHPEHGVQVVFEELFSEHSYLQIVCSA